MNTRLLDALRWARDRVLETVVLVDGLPELGERAVLLQRVGAFGPEILVHGRIPHGAVNHIHLLGQVLERPAVGIPVQS